MLQLLAICQSDQELRPDEMARLLKVSKRTLFRDIRGLSEIGVLCKYNSSKRRYEVVQKSEFSLSQINLSASEVHALLMLVHKAPDRMSFPFRRDALLAALKIESHLPTMMRRRCNFLLQNCSVRPEPRAQVDLLDERIFVLQEAIARRNVVKLVYQRANTKDTEIHLKPYHLFYADYGWHVVGKSDSQKSISVFTLHLIKNLAVTEKVFTDGHKFDLHRYLGGAWSVKPEGRLYNIKLRFLPDIAQQVAAIQWHKTQSVIMEDDGSAIIEFRVDGLNEIIWWILGYGDRVKVLSPGTLRQRITETVKRMLDEQ